MHKHNIHNYIHVQAIIASFFIHVLAVMISRVTFGSHSEEIFLPEKSSHTLGKDIGSQRGGSLHS